MWLSLIGALLCVAVMFIINWWTALITFAVIGGIFVYVHYRKPGTIWSLFVGVVYSNLFSFSIQGTYILILLIQCKD